MWLVKNANVQFIFLNCKQTKNQVVPEQQLRPSENEWHAQNIKLFAASLKYPSQQY